MNDTHCRRKRLAESSVAMVEQCTCGKLHLHVGPVTLHFERDAFAALVHTLETAVNTCQSERHRIADDLRLLFGQVCLD